jgi:hypothetical protein
MHQKAQSKSASTTTTPQHVTYLLNSNRDIADVVNHYQIIPKYCAKKVSTLARQSQSEPNWAQCADYPWPQGPEPAHSKVC